MTTDALLGIRAVVDELARRLALFMPISVTGVHAWTLPEDALAPFVLVVGGAGTTELATWGRDQVRTLTVATYAVGRTTDQALAAGDLVRNFFLARQLRGAWANEIDLSAAGVGVVDRGEGTEPISDSPQGVPQVVEGFVLSLARVS